jgi:hypothetical protein
VVRWLVYNRGVVDEYAAGDIFLVAEGDPPNDPVSAFEAAVGVGNVVAASILLRAGVHKTTDNQDLLALAYFSGPDTLQFVLDNILLIYPEVPKPLLEFRIQRLTCPTHASLGYVAGRSIDPLPSRDFNQVEMQGIVRNFNISVLRTNCARNPVLIIQALFRRALARCRVQTLRMIPDHQNHGIKRKTVLGVEGTCSRMKS